MGFLGVVVNCFDVLAWPLFALVYPLCVSIRAIEIDSGPDTMKLAAYWVLFALLFLFEYCFVNLLEWIPFWLYIKLIISCWLVIPNFDGAFYVYKHFLCACLYMGIKVLINWLEKRKKFFFWRDEFEYDQVKRFIKDNGPKASEKLFASKVKLQTTDWVQKDVKAVVVTEKNDKTAAKEVDPTEPDLALMENNNFAPKEIQEILESVASNVEYPEVLVFPNKFEKRKCSLCQVTAESETTWNSHLQGQRHAAALETLKANKRQLKKAASEAKNQASKTKVAPASEDKRSGIPVRGPENNAGRSKSDQKLQQEIMKNKYVERRGANKWRCTICNASCNSLNDINCHLGGSKHLAKVHTTGPDLSRLENNNFAPKKSQEISESEASNTGNKFWKQKCSLCQVTAESEITWNSHLQGQRHAAALETLKAQKQQLKKAACEAKNQASKTKVAPEDKRSGMPVQGPENNAGSSKSDQKLQQKIMKNKYVELTGANKWRCTICNASCNSLNNINSHLKGRRHLEKIG